MANSYMAVIGLMGLLVGFAALVVSVVALAGGVVLQRKKPQGAGETLVWGGHLASLVVFISLTFCCALLIYAFVSGDQSIEYVVKGTSHDTSAMGTFYRISGLWEGREGSLLVWAWLISLFSAVMSLRNMKKLDRLNSVALIIMQVVMMGFVGILLFSEDNSPFVAMASNYFDEQGNLTGAAALWGMNPLLEHWAMAVHPPALFIGYAGLTVPFAYAIAALICNDSSDAWVRASQRYLMVAWLLLGIGIGLGSVWAYVVLGWGGYWGWDAVENASLLPWLSGVALIHSLTVYRQRGAFKRWSVMCACVTFAFVILGTFISRSGLVQSVHAFEGDPVSLVLFGSLIAISLLAGVLGLLWRWKSFGPKHAADEAVDSLFSREAAYYFNNVLMLVFAVLVCYLTVASALPSWLPFGGTSVSTGTFDTVARPLGIVYCAVIAVCPLLGWAKTDREAFIRRAKIPAIAALVLFALLMFYWATYLIPTYNDAVNAGTAASEAYLTAGPAVYYLGLAALGFLVASLLFFNTLFMIGKTVAAWSRAHEVSFVVGFFKMMKEQASRIGGYIAHLAMAVILVGLICSSMFVTEKTGYVNYDKETDTAENFTIQDYTLVYTGNSITEADGGADIYYTIEYDVYRNDAYVGHVSPNVQLVVSTQQTKSNTGVLHFADEDLFVIYKGANSNGAFSMDVRVNPQISLVWIGFGMLVVGALIAAVGGRSRRNADEQSKR